MNYVIAAILGALAMLWAILLGKRSNVHDNRSRAGTIRDSLTDSKDRADDIADKAAGAAITAGDVAKHIGSASASLDAAIGVVQSIRRKGATSSPVAQSGPDRD